jgi:prepilin-type N-terminal cleavage/methylation domain-containing protein
VRARLRSLRLRGEAGYNLVEMLTVMVIMSIVFAGITTVFVAGSKAQNEQDRRFRAQLNTRLALDKIRKDIHCATDVTNNSPAYPSSNVTIKLPSGCGGDVSWCTVAVTGFTNRYALYRQSGASCGSTGIKYGDYLTIANVFPAFAHTSGCGCLASLQLDFPVSLKGSTIDQYELTDTVYLRNSTRI